MKTYFGLIINILALAMIQIMCSQPKKLNKPFKEQITIGNGGGFAGIETLWTLTEDGIVKSEGKPDLKLKSRDVKQAFNNYRTLELSKVNLMSPGNIYELIEYQDDMGKSHKIVWDASKKHEGNYKLFFDYINHLIQKEIK